MVFGLNAILTGITLMYGDLLHLLCEGARHACWCMELSSHAVP